MTEVQWQHYPLVAQREMARKWLRIQANLQLAPKTVDAYGRSLQDFITFCDRGGVDIATAAREDIAGYVNDLATRPNSRNPKVRHIRSGTGLSNATMQQRLTAVRLFYDFLIEEGLRGDNPVGRGKYTPGKGWAGKRDRALIPHFDRQPWVPSDDQFGFILRALKEESVRNRAMLLLAYEGAIRREELISLEVGDVEFPYRQVAIRPEISKNHSGRIVLFSRVTSTLLRAYLDERRNLTAGAGPLFLSESNRNRGRPLSVWTWSKIVQRIAHRAGTPQFTTHTPRHLRLTHMARSGMDIHEIAEYAGHRNLETTRLYIHLSGRDLADRIKSSMSGLDQWIDTVLHEDTRQTCR